MIEFLLGNFSYWICMILFLIGLYVMIAKENLIKKIMGLNILQSSIFLFLILLGNKKGGVAPIIVHPAIVPGVVEFVNPLPQALVLTGIVVAVAFTAFGLALAIKIYKKYGTLDAEKLMEL